MKEYVEESCRVASHFRCDFRQAFVHPGLLADVLVPVDGVLKLVGQHAHIDVRAGRELKGVAIGGVGVGAPRITGLMIAGIGVGAEQARGVVIAPAYFKVEPGGMMRGVSVSAFNDIRGRQHGLTIGLLNIADELHGVQIGLINIARNKRSFSVLPFVNYHR